MVQIFDKKDYFVEENWSKIDHLKSRMSDELEKIKTVNLNFFEVREIWLALSLGAKTRRETRIVKVRLNRRTHSV